MTPFLEVATIFYAWQNPARRRTGSVAAPPDATCLRYIEKRRKQEKSPGRFQRTGELLPTSGTRTG